MINLIIITIIELDVDIVDVVCYSLAIFYILKWRRKLQHVLLSVIYFGNLFVGFR